MRRHGEPPSWAISARRRCGPTLQRTSAQSDAPPVMTADEALAIIDRITTSVRAAVSCPALIHDVMKLRALGFKPSNTNKEAITKALDYRPNQAPLSGFAGDAVLPAQDAGACAEREQPGATGVQHRRAAAGHGLAGAAGRSG
jgi:hypothetical protein